MQIESAMLRAGIDNYGDMHLRFLESELPEEIEVTLSFEDEGLTSLNEMCTAISKLDSVEKRKLSAVVSLANPENASQITNLAEQLDLFDFVPDATTPADYGRYMIQEPGHFEYDENLEGFYDFEKYGRQWMNDEEGTFTPQGYVAYRGFVSLEEVMGGVVSERMDFQMGGLK